MAQGKELRVSMSAGVRKQNEIVRWTKVATG
jgi:hypothetical protein